MSLGSTISKSVKFSIPFKDDSLFNGKKVVIYIGLQTDTSIEWIKKATLNIIKTTKNGNLLEFECYDSFYFCENVFITELKGNQKIKDIVNEQCSKLNIVFNGEIEDVTYNIDLLQGLTVREVFSYLSAYCGKNAHFNSNDELEFIGYTEYDLEISPDRYASIETVEQDTTINSLTCITKKSKTDEDGNIELVDETLISGDGFGISFSCLGMTQERLDILYQRFKGFTYRSCEIDLSLSYPEIECGDILIFSDLEGNKYNVPVMEIISMCDGGFKSEIKSFAKTEQESEFEFKGSLANQVERNYTEYASFKEVVSEKVKAFEGEFGAIDTDILNVYKELNVVKGDIKDLNVDDLKAKVTTIEKAYISKEEVEESYVNKSTVNDLSVKVSKIETSYVEKQYVDTNFVKTQYVDANFVNKQYANENYVNFQYANQTYAVKSEIKDLTADVAKINTLLAGSVISGSTQTIVLNAENTTIANALIKDANIDSLSFNKIKGVDVNTTKLTVHSNDGLSTWKDNTILIKDSNRNRVQIGKDAQGDYNIYIWDKNGKLMFDPLGLTEDGVNREVIDNSNVKPNAGIDGSKLDIDSVIKEVNGATTTIKSSRIYFDDKKQSLDVVFNSMSTTVTEHSKTIETVQSDVTSAKSNASNALSKAETASSNASTALTKANTAITDSSNAKSDASNALSKATSIETRANNGEFDGRGVDKTSIAYQVSTSGTVAPTGTWLSNPPTVPAGQFLWTRSIFTYTDGTSTTSYSVSRAGTDGTTGAKGDKGDTGNGISSITNYYLATSSSSGITVNTSGWTTTPQSVTSSKKYHWNYQVIAYTNGTTATINPAIIGVYGDTGNTGATGKGITSVTPQYYLSTSNTTQSGGSWKTAQDAWTAGKYYWTRDAIVWTDGTTSYTSPVLDVGLNNANANASNAITKVNTVEETVKTQSTQISTAQGQIGTLITDVTQAKKDITATKGDITTAKGNITTLTNNYSSLKQTVDGINSTVANHTSQITNVQGTANNALNLINNLEIGGRNYFSNRKKADGNGKTFNANNEYTLDPYPVDGGCFTQFYNLTVPMSTFLNKDMVISFYAKSPNGAAIMYPIYNRNGVPKYLISVKSIVGNILGTSWSKVVAHFTVTQNTATDATEYPSNKIEFYCPKVPGVIIKDVMVEEGSKASGWTPAPEDLYNKIDTVNKNLTVSIETISDKAAKLEQSLDGFKTSVSNTYATKAQLNTVDGKFASYSTTTAMNSAITQAKNEISQKVTSVETNVTNITKTVNDNKANWDKAPTALTNANNAQATANTAKTTADTAKTTANTALTNANNAKDYTDKAKNQFGYQYKYDIVIYGESNKYYPVVIKGGNQYVFREIMVKRSYSEQAPADWNTSTHMGGLTITIKCNFGDWGGANYSWAIHDFEETYSTMFAGASHVMSYMGFAIFLRGGGTTGAKYHLYSDQPIERGLWYGGTSPQICLNQDLIGWYGGTVDNPTYKWNAPAHRTTPNKEEIDKRMYIKLSQANQIEITATKKTVAEHTTSLNNITSRVSTTESNITKINGNITALQEFKNTAEQKITDSAIVATVTKSTSWSNLNNTATTANNTANSALTKANNLIDLTTIKDTRSNNENPRWYMTNYPKKTVKEFKICTTVGVTGEGSYGVLVTEVTWENKNGGYPTQLFYPSESQNVYRRVGTSATAWSAWTKVAGTHNIVSTINQTAESIKIQASKISLEGIITANSYFKINTDGSMVATSGKIGKFNITSSYIDTGSGTTNAGMGGNQAFWAGSESSNSAPFHVGYDGSLYASKATITGNINGGSITGNTTINVGTDLTIGNNIYIGSYSDKDIKKYIYFNDRFAITSRNDVLAFGVNNGDPFKNKIYMTYSGAAMLNCSSINLISTNGVLMQGGEHHINGDTHFANNVYLGSDQKIYGLYYNSRNNLYVNAPSGYLSLYSCNNVVYYDGKYWDADWSAGRFYPGQKGVALGGPAAANRWYRLYAANACSTSSDARLKTNITNLDERYVKLFEKLKPITYNWKTNVNSDKEAGLIAQEVEQSMKECGITNKEFGFIESNGDYLGLIYQHMDVLTLNYVQVKSKEFYRHINEHDREIANLKMENENFKHEIYLLKQEIKQLRGLA